MYKHAHGAPARISQFTCAVPEHLPTAPTPHISHPGCFATATLLASVPLLALKMTDTRLFIAGITGSTGSGRRPSDATHHPLRHGDVYSYGALEHRHVPEIAACAQFATGIEAQFNFVPHSGPFARGIHVTVQGEFDAKPMTSAQASDALAAYYRDCPFVRVTNVGSAGEGCGHQQLRALERGHQRQVHSGDGGTRQLEQGSRGRWHAMDESPIGIR